MFIIKYFKEALKYGTVFKLVSEKTYKVIIFFLLLTLIQLFPMNFQIVSEQGWRLDFIQESFQAETQIGNFLKPVGFL